MKPANCLGFLALNMAERPLQGQPEAAQGGQLRHRPDGPTLAQAGPYCGHAMDPPSEPGRAQGRYEAEPPAVLARGRTSRRARRLAARTLQGRQDHRLLPHLRHCIEPGTRPKSSARTSSTLGSSPENITMRGFSGGRRSTPPWAGAARDADIGVSMGWCSDFPDPEPIWTSRASTFSPDASLLDMTPAMERSSTRRPRLVGPRASRALGKLDLEIMRKVAPVAVMRTYNNRYFFSDRVDPRSLSVPQRLLRTGASRRSR